MRETESRKVDYGHPKIFKIEHTAITNFASNLIQFQICMAVSYFSFYVFTSRNFSNPVYNKFPTIGNIIQSTDV